MCALITCSAMNYCTAKTPLFTRASHEKSTPPTLKIPQPPPNLVGVFTCCQIMFDHAHAPQDTMIARIHRINMYAPCTYPETPHYFCSVYSEPFPLRRGLVFEFLLFVWGRLLFFARRIFQFSFFIFKRALVSACRIARYFSRVVLL